MLLLLLLLAMPPPAPTAADVQAVEVTQVLGRYIDTDREGRPHAEFAPDVETRNPICTKLTDTVYECRYEARVKGFFEKEFGPWLATHRRISWQEDCWREEASSQW